MGEYRREIIGTAGSVLGIGFLSTKDSGDVAGPIIVDGSEGGPALEVKEAYLLDNGNKTATFTQYAGESYEVEGVLQNIGDEIGSRTFDLVVGESVEDERVVELNPAESQTVYFMPNAPSVSEQTTLSVMLGDSAVGELVVEPRVDISVTGAFLLDGSGNRVSSRTLTEGEILDAEADLENAGIDSGDISLALELEGTQLDSATTTVGPDAGTVVQALSGEVPQVDTSTEYAATIADQSAGTVTVEPAPAIPDSGISRWTFDNVDISSGVLSDLWGDNDITFSGTTTGQSGLATNYDSGESVSFDGVDDIGNSTFQPQITNRSLVGWVVSNVNQTFQHIAGVADYNTSAEAIAIYFDSNTNLRGEVKDGSNTAIVNTSASDSTIYHVALTVSSNNDVTFYVNGSSIGSNTSSLTTSTITTANDFTFGANYNNERHLDGKLDAWDFYSKELSSTEVSNHYNAGSING